mmetsp:Transcript_43619/g.113645  ORF Transcript_43619/g.113645 Transcript_43619/m.113645 type:complete len:544 (-) Transcript_43619:714-2345(-)
MERELDEARKVIPAMKRELDEARKNNADMQRQLDKCTKDKESAQEALEKARNGLIDECVSNREFAKAQADCFGLLPFTVEVGENEKMLRPLATHILDMLQACSMNDGTVTESIFMSCVGNDDATSIQHMLTAALGFNSASLDVQKRAETAIAAIIPVLPTMLEKCKHNQNVIRVIKEMRPDRDGKGGSAETSKRKKAEMRANVISALISNPSSSFSSTTFEVIRKEVDAELSILKMELLEAEEKVREQTQEERETLSGAAYLRAIQKMSIEKAKVAAPYLLSISEKLEIDLLELEGPHLATVLDVAEVKDVKGVMNDALRALEAYRKHIESEDERSASFCSTASLSSFLSGSAVEGTVQDPSIVATASVLAKTSPCECSRWRREFGQAWSYLEDTQAEWEELEGRVKNILAKRIAPAHAAELEALLEELEKSDLVNNEMENVLGQKMDKVLGVSDRRRSKKGSSASCKPAQEELCGECRERLASIRCMPCKHKSLCEACAEQVVPGQKEMDNLRMMGFHPIGPGDSPIICPTCYQKASVLSSL